MPILFVPDLKVEEIRKYYRSREFLRYKMHFPMVSLDVMQTENHQMPSFQICYRKHYGINHRKSTTAKNT